MSLTKKIIQSFNAGELDPRMDSRIDQVKYVAGCRIMENMFPLIYGGAERRPGTEYIYGCYSNSAKSRIVSFEHSVDDVYILEFANQTIRVFRNGGIISGGTGTEDISALDNILAHWKLNDNAANTTVTDSDGATHNGTSSANTNTLTATGKISSCFNFGGTAYVTVTDHNDFTFGNGTADSAFSIFAWIYYNNIATTQAILSKSSLAAGNNQEWFFGLNDSKQLVTLLYKQDNSAYIAIQTDDVISAGWHFVAFTYDGSGTTGMKLYVDGVLADSTAGMSGTYAAMNNTATNVRIGDSYNDSGGSTYSFGDKIDNVAIFGDVLTASEILSLFSSSVYTITSPYLTADLFVLKFEHSADVMYITHPDYEPRKLSRIGHSAWTLEETALATGPFRAENTNMNITITPSATTGSVTLTATGNIFVSGTTMGHVPSGTAATSKSLTGALFKIVHAVSSNSVAATLVNANDVTSELTVYKGVTWDFTTNATWTGTCNLQREYNNSGVWETLVTCTSVGNKNITSSDTENTADAQYRVILAAGAGTSCQVQLSVRDSDHIGIAEITAVTDAQHATATVLTTLGAATATHRWSEGEFSNYRGWPIAVVISPEERMTFAGSATNPLNIWGSVIGDYTNFKEGVLDDDAVNFTIIGGGKQNTIRWIVSKKTLMVGTVGGEHLIGASDSNEALTPTNITVKSQTTYGSEDIQALLVNQAILFLQRGGRKIRELIYDYESDSHKADDLTVFAHHITESGIVDMAFQRTPDPALWCVRDDGDIAVMIYERDQNVFSWSRIVTDGDIESVAICYGGEGEEDEVWCAVKRTVGGSTVRYIERFKPRDWGSDQEDAFFVDSGLTYDSTAATVISGLSHLAGKTVSILADGVPKDDQVVSASGTITLSTAASVVQAGLSYTSTLKPMKLDIGSLGLATTKKITKALINLYETGGAEYGTSTTNLFAVDYDDDNLFTGYKEVSFPAGYEREGDIIIRQTEPLPLTVLSLSLDVSAN